MNYNLNAEKKTGAKELSTLKAIVSLIGHMVEEKRILALAFTSMIISAALSLAGPLLIGHTVDVYIQNKQFNGVLVFSGILLVLYTISLITGYVQTKLMGGIGQRMLFTLRNTVFNKLQELPVDFFNQNKTGDLISRINNDTDKINQFFSQSLMQFLRFILIMIGAGIFLLSINLEIGAASLLPALIIWIFTRIISPWVKRTNTVNLSSVGFLSAEVQESLNNFNVIVAFNRRDYFRNRFKMANKDNYSTALSAGYANNLLMPVYSFFSNIGQLTALIFGIYFVLQGSFTLGFLISIIAYVTYFYNPLRQLATLWANFQVALAAWGRIRQILNLENNLTIVEDNSLVTNSSVISFQQVSFAYPNGKEVLHNIDFELEQGKTYAFVGPTGGGKTTTASLIARLYDPTKGKILLRGKDIRSYSPAERVKKIGFILQDPFIFNGSVRDNLFYANPEFLNLSDVELSDVFRESGLDVLINRFDDGLESQINNSGEGVSLGQKQLIAFMRAVLRKPDLLILDEASANIDTVTEKMLDEILQKLPQTTTKVIIAHRLNTIESADEIYFVNSGKIERAGSLADAVNRLTQGKLES